MGTVNNKFFTVDRILDRCKPGDLIEIYHPKCTFNHWAVYVGDETVVHVKQPWIKKEHLLSAAGGSQVRINNLKHRILNFPALEPDQIVEAALEQVGVEWYNLQFYGCEMFAVRCRYGVKVNMMDLYKNNNNAIGTVQDSAVAVSLSNPLVTYGHEAHENYMRSL